MSGFTHDRTEGSEEWYTPPFIFERLGLTFDLDPCHPVGDPLPWVPARTRMTIEDDGLATPWPAGARVFVNPPYGRETVKWMRKTNAQGNGVGLVFARVDVSWFHELAPTIDAVCFIKGRLQFVGRDGKPKPGKDGKVNSAGAGSMLLAWGPDCTEALYKSGLGLVTYFRK